MDFYRFVNSKDIREHLRSVGYEFTSLEAAWLVYRCRDATMFEKIEAWGYIIKSMPDCEVTVARRPDEHFRLHELLGKYIYEYDCLLFMILRRQNYTFEVLDKDNNVVYESNYIYQDTSNIRIIVHDRYKEAKEPLYCRVYADFSREHRNDIVIVYRIENGKMKKIDICSKNPESGHTKIREIFNDLWFGSFPVPFKKGDILWDPKRKEGFCGGPFVMTDITPNYCEGKTWKGFDGTDMIAWGYFQDEHGGIYEECMWNYMDLEYCPEEEIVGERRVLKALSNYLKYKIDLCLFARAYHQILSEEYARKIMPRGYDKTGLSLAGLTKKE